MKISAIKIKEDLLMRINRLKYQWGYKTQEDVIRKLIELATPELHTCASSTEPSIEERELAEEETGGTLKEEEK